MIGSRLALEFKSAEMVTERHLRGLKALREEGLIRDFAVVSSDPVRRKLEGVTIYPRQEFLAELWADQVV